jgi:MFS family permease
MIASQNIQQSPGNKTGVFYGYIVVVAASLTMLMGFSIYSAFGVFFKPVLTDFGWTRAMTAGAFSLSMILTGMLGIVMGGLTDRLGPRIVMTFCGLFLGLGYLLMSQVSAIWQFYLFYGVIIGTGMGGMWVPPLSIVARWFVKRRSLMTGIVLVGSGIGGFIGPPVISRLISAYDWRLSYIIVGSICLLVVILAAQFLRRDPDQMRQVPFGESGEGERGFKLEARALSLKEAIYTKQLWLVFSMLFCSGLCIGTVMVHIVPHATDVGISAVSAANFLATIWGVGIIGNFVLGSVGDRLGSKHVFIISFVLTAAVLFGLARATEVWMLYLFAVSLGFARGGMGTAQSPLVAELFGLRSHGMIFGLAGFGWACGAATGPFVAGYIFDVTTSYQMAFLISAAIGVIGLILCVLLTPTKELSLCEPSN